MAKAAPIFRFKTPSKAAVSPPRPNAYRRGYGGKDWTGKHGTRKRIFLRDNYICQMCGKIVIDDNKKKNNSNEGMWAECDHIVPVTQGGSDDDDNLQTLHKSCHSKKTRKEQQNNRKGGVK